MQFHAADIDLDFCLPTVCLKITVMYIDDRYLEAKQFIFATCC